MPARARWVVVVLGVLATGCATPTIEQRRAAAAPSLTSLREGDFEQADRHAGDALGGDGANPYARLVRAVVHYKKSMHQLSLDVRTVVIGGIGAGAFNHKYICLLYTSPSPRD